MTSSKPYLIRAIYDWLVDNQLTPHLLVNAQCSGVQVPDRFVENGQIVLNIAPQAVRQLQLGNNDIRFAARFSGVVYQIILPMAAIQSIYAFENGRGMLFDDEEMEWDSVAPDNSQASDQAEESADESNKNGGKKGRPHLKIIK